MRVKVLALTRYGRYGASSRMRTYQYVSTLGDMGIDLEVLPLFRDEYLKRLYSKQSTNWVEVFSDYFKRLFVLRQVVNFDLIWIEKELFPNLPACFEQILSVLGVRYIVDYDDAIFHSYDLSSNPVKRLLSHKINKVMRNATMVVCGNTYLADRARSAGASNIEIIPTVIDLNRYSVFKSVDNNCFVVGWIGSPQTVKYLEFVIPVLTELSKKYPLQLRVIGAQIESPGIDIDCRSWTEDSEVSEIHKIDVGIMPLKNSPWEHGKCGYKLIQYMACGKPVIASPIGVNSEIITHEQDGFHATSQCEWITALGVLIENEDIVRRMGNAGRKKVESLYSLQVTSLRLFELISRIA